MVNINNPADLINSLGNFQGNPSGESIAFRVLQPGEVSEHAKKIKSLRYWGVLPFAVTPTEQTLALFPFAGRPLSQWPVVMAFPEGEGFRTLASGIEKFVSCYTLGNIPYSEYPEDFIEAIPFLEKASLFFGDVNFEKIKKEIQKKKITQDNFKVYGYPLADPGSAVTEFFQVFHKFICDGSNPLLTWKAYVEKYPRFMPGWKMFLKTGTAEMEVHESASSAAWRIISSPNVRDNKSTFEEVNYGNQMFLLTNNLSEDEYQERDNRLIEWTWGDEDPIISAARLLVNDDLSLEVKERVEQLIPAVEELFQNEDYDGALHLTAAADLEKAGKLQLALDAARNSNFWSFEHNEETLTIGARVSASLGDKNLISVMDLFRE